MELGVVPMQPDRDLSSSKMVEDLHTAGSFMHGGKLCDYLPGRAPTSLQPQHISTARFQLTHGAVANGLAIWLCGM